LVQRVQGADEREAFSALNTLCETYWFPLYAFLRRTGAGPEDAADLCQGFFEQLVKKRFLSAADRDRGKLRTFLLDALKKFWAKEYRREQAQKRGGGALHFSIEQGTAENRFTVEPVDDKITPEAAYDRHWAVTVFDAAMKRLRENFEARGKSGEFECLKIYLSPGVGQPAHAETAARLGIGTGNVAVRIHRLRDQFRDALEAEVGDTLDLRTGVSVEEELRHLAEALG
jgi:RNA polymerase sigma-70 factor (ECF subfamily)